MNLINNQPDNDKIYLYAKDLHEAKYQYLINERQSTGGKYFNDHKAFIEYSNEMQDVYKNIEKQNLGKKRKIWIFFNHVICWYDLQWKTKSSSNWFFFRGIKLNFITQSYFKVKKVRPSTTHFFIIKIPNRKELQQIALNHTSDIDFKDFMKIYKKYTA